MISLYVADVGDGLAGGIKLVSGERIQIDCGSQQNPERAYEALREIHPDVFILSHFHADHYNGLTFPHHKYYFMNIKKVYLPRFPEFPSAPSLKRTFALALLATNLRVLGGRTGSMEADLLNLISALNHRSFSYHFLSQGDAVDIAGSQFEVLWPPREIMKDETVKAIRNAIEDFNTALDEDEATKRIYDSMEERRTVDRYLSEGERRIEPESPEPFERGEVEVPEVVSKANDSLRKAANRLSLAFREDNRLLFLGDLEKRELRQVGRELSNQGATNYFTLLTPHHGTHWHDSLQDLRCHIAFSSIGSRLFKHYCSEYKSISRRSSLTHTNGALVSSLALSKMAYHDWRNRWW